MYGNMAAPVSLTSFLLSVIIICTDCSEVSVSTIAGTYVGLTTELQFRGETFKLSKFLGIPYAEPPLGEYRFKPPEPKIMPRKPWNATEFGPSCLEVDLTDGTDYLTRSEDCLYLNIFAPEVKDGAAPLPVMVWIHGGGFYAGSGSTFDASFLASYGHVIVVTLNYRLSAWGFLSTGTADSPGNYGLLDQRMALRWVSANIAFFNGDKNSVTVFGNSAGGASVGYQALFARQPSLFNRVILQSGFPTAYWALSINPQQEAVHLAELLHCDTTNMTAMMDCLRKIPAEAIHKVLNDKTNTLAPNIQFYYRPCVDNDFVDGNPSDILDSQANDSFARASRERFLSFDLMTGTLSGDAITTMYFFVSDPENFLPDKKEFEDELIPAFLDKWYRYNMTSDQKKLITEKVVAEYTVLDNSESLEKFRDRMLEVYGDVEYIAPQQQVLSSYSRSPSSSSTYMYYFDVPIPSHLLETPSWYVNGSNHADETAVLFIPEAYFDYMPEQLMTFTVQMITMWTNFAKTGNPNQPLDIGKHWPPYSASRHVYFEITGNPDTDSVKERFREEKAFFWNKVLPRFISKLRGTCGDCSDTSGVPLLQPIGSTVMGILVTLLYCYIE